MSTLRISNIEAKANSSSPSVDEKLKFTNSSGDVLVHLDGKTSGITTIGINTTAESLKFDSNNNIYSTGIITATKFSGIFDGTTVTATTGTFSGDVSIGGTLTYQDVTNIDSVGIITARSDIRGGRNLNVTGLSTFTDAVSFLNNAVFGDNDKVRFGGSNDLNIYHENSSTTNWIEGTGLIRIQTVGNIEICPKNGAEKGAKFITDGAAELYYDGTKRISTSGIGVTVAGTIDLDAISTTISDTAVDLFVYDTRKDSDGGAWRKRTSHTSWYNETFGTRRGSKKEFPAVAVIVVIGGTVSSYGNDNGNMKIKIYDGDDPTMPLWMEFNGFSNTDNLLRGGANYPLNGVYALNGTMCFTRNGGYGMGLVSFIDEKIYSYWDASSRALYNGSIADRNSGKSIDSQSGYGLANATTYDVAMTILPNAPIDEGTELPTPTIVVTTNGGVTVITDNGNVVDIQQSLAWKNVNIGEVKGRKVASYAFGGGATVRHTYLDNLSSDAGNNVSYEDYPLLTAAHHSTNAPRGGDAYGSTTKGLAIYDRWNNPGSLNNADYDDLLAYITSESNTGWMVGSIKGAYLSSNDDTNITGSELLTNGDFSNGTTGWTERESGGTFTVSGGQATMTYSSGATSWQTTATVVVGKTYTISFDIVSTNLAGIQAYYDNGSGAVAISVAGTGAFKATKTFVATSTSLTIWPRLPSSGNMVLDNFSVREAVDDRSKNNEGLQANGTITKTAVATGAELVSYGPFSSSNFLRQPYAGSSTYPSIHHYETGNFHIMFWMNNSGTNVHQTLVSRDNREFDVSILDNTTYSRRFRVYSFNSSNSLQTFDSTDDPFPLNTWCHVCVNYTGGNTASIYVNGDLNKTGDLSYDIDDTTNGLNIGVRNTSGTYAHPATGTKLALVRIAKSNPSPEQIKKIYYDEKKLFAPNAKCTLHGSSDGVTALAFDDSTNNIHVGTSAGRSEFSGLNRINNTTTAVTAAISASNGLVVDE